MVSASTRHLYQPGWLYVPFGRQDPRALSRPAAQPAAPPRAACTSARSLAWIPPSRTVTLAGRASACATITWCSPPASRVDPEDMPGFAEGAHHFYTEEAALRLHAALEEFQGGRIVVGVGGLPYKCPVAPLEFTFLLDEYLTDAQPARPDRDRLHLSRSTGCSPSRAWPRPPSRCWKRAACRSRPSSTWKKCCRSRSWRAAWRAPS